MEISLYGDRYQLTLLDETTYGTLPLVPDAFEQSVSVYTCDYRSSKLQVFEHRRASLKGQSSVPRDETLPLDQDKRFWEEMQAFQQLRMRFVLTPLHADGSIDLTMRQNYKNGEIVNFGSFWHYDHEVDPYAVYRYVPTLWTPSFFLKEKELDPQVVAERKEAGKLFNEESEIVQWIHMDGLMISRFPYFLYDLRKAIKEGMVVGWKS